MTIGRSPLMISHRVVLAAAGIVMVGLLAAFAALTVASLDLHQSADGATAAMALALAAIGIVVAGRQSRNPIGRILLGSGLATILATDAELYLVLDTGFITALFRSARRPRSGWMRCGLSESSSAPRH